jgi:hypothetical protein
MEHKIAFMLVGAVMIAAAEARGEVKEVSPALSTSAAAEWNFVAGQWKLGDGILEQEDPEGPIGPLAGVASAILKDPAFTDFKMTAEFNIRSEGDGERSAMLIFRATGTLSYYGLYMDSLGPKSGNAILARSTFRNRWIEIARRPCALGPDSWHRAEVECRGAKITVTIDKTPVMSVEDKALASGRVGLGRRTIWVAPDGKTVELLRQDDIPARMYWLVIDSPLLDHDTFSRLYHEQIVADMKVEDQSTPKARLAALMRHRRTWFQGSARFPRRN